MYIANPKYLFAFMVLAFCASCHNNLNRNVTEGEFPILKVDTILLDLSKKVDETSGLVDINGDIWTHNDSGGKPILYEINLKSGKISDTEEIKKAKNKDWEDLTIDSTYIYIGDYGNNHGGRKDLKIYKVPISNLDSKDNESAVEISFSYPDQTKYYNGYNHNFDCESLINKGDSLYLFTKNWSNQKCKLYKLDKVNPEQEAEYISEFDTQGLITGASLDEKNRRLFLLGYIRGGGRHSFIWVLEDWQGHDFFSGTKTRYDLSVIAQTEGIVYSENHGLLVSAEAASGGQPTLYRVLF